MERPILKTSESLLMNWKTILFIGGIAIGAVMLWNKYVAPKTGIKA